MTPMWHGQTSRRQALRGVGLLASSGLAAVALAACGASAVATPTSATTQQASTLSPVAKSSSPAASASSSAAVTTSVAPSTTASSSAAAPASGAQLTPTPAAGETRKGAATTVDLSYGWGGTTAIQTWDALGQKMGTDLTAFNVRWIVGDNGTKLVTAVAGGSPPDVAVGNAPYSEYWAKGVAVTLDDYVAKSKLDLKTDIPASSWVGAAYKGKTFGVPAVEAFVRLGFALDMTNLKQVGVDPKTFSWDWDTITQMQQQLTKKAPDGSLQLVGIDALDASGGNIFYWSNAWGIDYFDDKTGKFSFDNDQFAEALTVLKKVYDLAGGPDKINGLRKQYGTWTENPKAMFPSGVEDMLEIGYYAPGELAHSSPSREFAFTWSPVPAAKKGFKFQTLGGHNAFIPQGAKHVAEGFQLIEYLVGDSAEQVIFDGQGWLGARQSFLQKVDFSKYPGLDFYANSVKGADKLFGVPSDPMSSFTGQQFSKAQQDVITNKAQPGDALKQLQQLVTEQFKQRFPNG